MRPEVGISSPAIMRKVVVLPQPDGPSRTKKLAVGDDEVRVTHRDEVAERLCRLSRRISAITPPENG